MKAARVSWVSFLHHLKVKLFHENLLLAPPNPLVPPKLPNKVQPANWQQIYANIKLMRQSKNAPVDTMGCAECADGDDEKSRRFQILVSLMISSQTKDREFCCSPQWTCHKSTLISPLNWSHSCSNSQLWRMQRAKSSRHLVSRPRISLRPTRQKSKSWSTQRVSLEPKRNTFNSLRKSCVKSMRATFQRRWRSSLSCLALDRKWVRLGATNM